MAGGFCKFSAFATWVLVDLFWQPLCLGPIGFGGGRKTEEGDPEKQRDDLSVWSFGMVFFSEIVFTTLR